MSKYVSPENQTLLWQVISKNEFVNHYFSTGPNLKVQWFKSIIQMFYEQNKNRTIDTTELLVLNKQTISYMIQNIREKNMVNVPNKYEINKTQLTETNFLKPYSITENRVEKIGNQFQEKQAEYNSLFERKNPETIDFAEKQDKPLSNMDELIKQHLKEREDELRKYSPLPVVSPPQPTIKTNKLKIDETNNNINIQIEEIKYEEKENEEKIKKSVSWSDNNNTDRIEKQQLEINQLKAQIDDISEKIKLLLDKFP